MPVPSSSLLRFLRSQSEEICFFTTNARADQCQHSCCRSNRALLHHFASPRRHLNTTAPQQAIVQPYLSNLDHSSHQKRREIPGGSTAPSSAKRLWPCVPNENNNDPHTPRYVSTDSRPFLRKILGRRKVDVGLKSDDLPPLPSFLDDVNGSSFGRSKSVKGTNELKLRCTEFNEDGKVTLVNGEFKKTELIAKVRLDHD